MDCQNTSNNHPVYNLQIYNYQEGERNEGAAGGVGFAMKGEAESGPSLIKDDYITYIKTIEYYRGLDIDTFVRWRLERAFQSFQKESYDSCIIYIAAALEEELARLYVEGHIEQILDENTGKPKDIVDVNCQALLDHAGDVITKSNKPLYESILIARNYHAHSHRRMRIKTKNRIKEKSYIRYWRKKTGEINGAQPYLGWLFSQECSLVALGSIVNLMRVTTDKYPTTRRVMEESE